MTKGSGLHHMHRRERNSSKLAPYPHPNKWINYLDNLLLAIAVIAPLMNIPQVLRIFMTREAEGVSIISFACFALFDIPWLIYGIVHKAKPIIVAYSLWFLTNLAVVAGVLIYG
jgi:uncharacterized protein with PQ loop repeat